MGTASNEGSSHLHSNAGTASCRHAMFAAAALGCLLAPASPKQLTGSATSRGCSPAHQSPSSPPKLRLGGPAPQGRGRSKLSGRTAPPGGQLHRRLPPPGAPPPLCLPPRIPLYHGWHPQLQQQYGHLAAQLAGACAAAAHRHARSLCRWVPSRSFRAAIPFGCHAHCEGRRSHATSLHDSLPFRMLMCIPTLCTSCC